MFYVSYRDERISSARSILLIIDKVLHCQNQLAALYPQVKKPKTPSELQPFSLWLVFESHHLKHLSPNNPWLHPETPIPQSTGLRLSETTWSFCTMLKPNVMGVEGGWVSCVPWHVEVVTVGEGFGEFLVHPCFTYHISSSPPIISSTIHQPISS